MYESISKECNIEAEAASWYKQFLAFNISRWRCRHPGRQQVQLTSHEICTSNLLLTCSQLRPRARRSGSVWVCVARILRVLRLCWQPLLQKQRHPTPPHPLATVIYCLSPALHEAFRVMTGCFYERGGKKFNFIWLSALRGKLRTAQLASRPSIDLTRVQNYDLVNSRMPAFSSANTSIIHLGACIFYLIWYYFQVTIHDVVVGDVTLKLLEWWPWASSWSSFRMNLSCSTALQPLISSAHVIFMFNINVLSAVLEKLQFYQRNN